MKHIALLSILYLLVVLPVIGQTNLIDDSDVQWSLAAVGDVIMNRQVSPYDQPNDPAFHDLANLIRSADAAFMNLEQSVFRLADFEGWPAPLGNMRGNYELGPPETLFDLKLMGFDLFNNIFLGKPLDISSSIKSLYPAEFLEGISTLHQ